MGIKLVSPFPLVLVHGLWDSPNIFKPLKKRLAPFGIEIFSPHLPHRLGRTPLEVLAEDLQDQISARFGPEQALNVLGFSMGGVVLRCWLQLLGGDQRTKLFVSLGSPQKGTLTALPAPRWLLPGIADMQPGSPLLQILNSAPSALQNVECHSFYCLLDAMVVPSWLGVLPVGSVQQLPVWNHRQLIKAKAALDPLVELLLVNNGFNRGNVGHD